MLTGNILTKTGLFRAPLRLAIVKSHSSAQQLKAMTKLLNKSSRKKKLYMSSVDVTYLPSAKEIGDTSGESGVVGRRRVNVLNKLFMKHITDQMATGTISDMIFGRQIEISKVTVAPDFTVCNVYWFTKGTKQDKETEEILKKVGGMLRHELTQLRLIGVVPKIQFAKDRSHAKLMEIDEKLSQADFGEDFVPTDPSFFLKTEFMLRSRLDPHTVEKIRKLEESEEQQEEKEEVIEEKPLPPMRNVVFGLDRDRIISQITKFSKIKPCDDGPVTYGLGKITTPSIYNNESRAKLNEFLKQRKITHQQRLKAIRFEIEERTKVDEDYVDDKEDYPDNNDEEYDSFDFDGILNEISKKE